MDIGELLSPTLVKIENALWMHEAEIGSQPRYTDEGFRAAVKIFMSAMSDRAYDLTKEEGLDEKDCLNMIGKVADDLRSLIKTYTGIDTMDLYKYVKTNTEGYVAEGEERQEENAKGV